MYKKILITLDGSPLAESALPHAEAIGKQFEAELVLLQVMSQADFMPMGFHRDESKAYLDGLHENARAEAERYLMEKAAALSESGLPARAVIEEGSVVETILRVAEAESVDLIAMATHGWSGVSRWVYGSVADKVLRSASHPLLLVRSAESAD